MRMQTALVENGVSIALMQRSVAVLHRLGVYVKALQRRRDRLVEPLRLCGNAFYASEFTFYLVPTASDPRGIGFVESLDKVFVLPGSIVDLVGRFPISNNANDEMVERTLPVFEVAKRV
jgi:hypothetical protein